MSEILVDLPIAGVKRITFNKPDKLKATEDAKEKRASFLENRQPTFHNK